MQAVNTRQPSWQIQAIAELELRRRKNPQSNKDERAILWQPNPDKNGIPNPQRLAVESEATILGYGGAAGGGKTDLLLGLAATQHYRSVIFRRVFPNLRSVIERSREILNPEGIDNSKDSYNESLHRWVLDGGRMIEFEACQFEKDREKQRGRPRDFYGFDEATEFSRSMIDFITAWLRTTRKGQRTRIVLTFNPPIDESGSWVIDFFLPWFAFLYPDKFSHPKPAAPGEIRWYAVVDGNEVERPDGEAFEHNGETIKPMSRTFIPAKLADNPHLEGSGYEQRLQALPEPLRSQLLYGDFAASAGVDPWQVIPTEWIQAAMDRWTENGYHVPLTAIGADVSRGGNDQTVLTKRFGEWIGRLIKYAGAKITDGKAAAQVIINEIKPEEKPMINIDAIGVGSSPVDILNETDHKVNAVNVASAARYYDPLAKKEIYYTDKSGLYKFKNLRSYLYWKLREMLEPGSGYEIALPNDNELKQDLSAAKFTISTAGIQVESKDQIKDRIGRSPDCGDSVLLSIYEPYDISEKFDIDFF